MPFRWTPDRVERIKVLWRKGYSFTEIAEKIGATRGQVAGKLYRCDVLGRRDPVIAWAAKSRAQGRLWENPTPEMLASVERMKAGYRAYLAQRRVA